VTRSPDRLSTDRFLWDINLEGAFCGVKAELSALEFTRERGIGDAEVLGTELGKELRHRAGLYFGFG
jgi:hypothetical protein